MSATCERVVGYNDDDRLPSPLPIVCGKATVAEVAANRHYPEWCACEEHADEAERGGALVERWS